MEAKQFNTKEAEKRSSYSVDLNIVVDGGQFGTHWKILKEHSVFFEEIYHRRKKSRKKQTQEAESEIDSVHLKGICAELFDKFLDYVYTKRKKFNGQRQFLLQEIRDVVKFSVMFQLRDLVNLMSIQCLRDLDVNMAKSGLYPMSELHQALLRFLYDGTTIYRTKDIAKFVAYEAYKDGSLECLLGVLTIVSDGRRKRVEMKLKLLDIAIDLFSTSLEVSGRQTMAVDNAGRCVLEEGGGASKSRIISERGRSRGRDAPQGHLIPTIQLSHSRRPKNGVASPLQQNQISKKMHNLNLRTADIAIIGSQSNSDLNDKIMAKDNQKNPQNKATKINQKAAKERYIKKPKVVTNDASSKEYQHVVFGQEHTVRNQEHAVRNKEHAVRNQHAVCNQGHAVFGKKHAVCGMEHTACDQEHVACDQEQAVRNKEHTVFGKKHAADGMEHVASANNAKQEYRKTRSESTANPKELRGKTFIEQETKIIRRKVRKLWTKEQTAPTIHCPNEPKRNQTGLEPSVLISTKASLSKPEGETPVAQTPNEETAEGETSEEETAAEETAEGETSAEETPKGDTVRAENPVKSPSLRKMRERLFLTGGIQKNNYFARRVVLEYDPINDVYMNHSAMKTSRYNHGVAQVGRDLYFVGGNSGFFEQLRSVESHSIERAEWSTITSMREARDEFSLVECGGFLYAIGGHNGVHDLRSVEKFSAGENSWSFVSPMGNYRAGACAVAVENRHIYVTGGFNGQIYLNTVEQYDTTTDTWTAVEPMNNKRAYSCLVLVAHSMYVIGGFNGQNTQSMCEVFDTPTRTWSAIPDMNTPRMNAAAIVFGELVFVFGGECEGVFLETVECYNINNNTWSFVQRLPQPVAGLRACVYVEEIKPENTETSL